MNMAEYAASLTPAERKAANFMPRQGWSFSNEEVQQCARLQKAWEDFIAVQYGGRSTATHRTSADQRRDAQLLKEFLGKP